MLTVLLATYDGAETLPEALEGWRRVVAPPGGWRLLVVDDGSRDASADLVAASARDLPLVLRRVPHRGQSAARNAVLGDLQGDLVVLTDDDVVPSPDALAGQRQSSHRAPRGSGAPALEVAAATLVARVVPSVAHVRDPRDARGPDLRRRGARALRRDPRLGLRRRGPLRRGPRPRRDRRLPDGRGDLVPPSCG